MAMRAHIQAWFDPMAGRHRRPLRRLVHLLVGVSALACLVTSPVAADELRPPDALAVADPIHDDLEALAARGLIQLPGLYARPLYRYDIALALARALDEDSGRRRDPAFRRALDAFSTELDVVRSEENEPGARSGLLDLRDDSSWLRAEVFASTNAEASPDQDRVYAALHTRYADILIGRDRLAWGPGSTGTLLLSETARPFTQLRLSRSFFDGLFHAVIVNGVLNQAEERYIAYHRLDWHPTQLAGRSPAPALRRAPDR
jgi:hypothetical protein